MPALKLDPDAPAFPGESAYDDQPRFADGLTVRQHTAIEMAKGLISRDRLYSKETVAILACEYADALIDALNQPRSPT